VERFIEQKNARNALKKTDTHTDTSIKKSDRTKLVALILRNIRVKEQNLNADKITM